MMLARRDAPWGTGVLSPPPSADERWLVRRFCDGARNRASTLIWSISVTMTWGHGHLSEGSFTTVFKRRCSQEMVHQGIGDEFGDPLPRARGSKGVRGLGGS